MERHSLVDDCGDGTSLDIGQRALERVVSRRRELLHGRQLHAQRRYEAVGIALQRNELVGALSPGAGRRDNDGAFECCLQRSDELLAVGHSIGRMPRKTFVVRYS